MRVLVVHITDLHIAGADAPSLGRVEAIRRALNAVPVEHGLVLLILTGDITFSGKDDEYLLAAGFVDDVRKALTNWAAAAAVPPRVATIVVPGNHDCDHAGGTGVARDVLIAGVQADPAKALDPNIVALCTEPQDGFFSFLDLVAPPTVMDKASPISRLVYEYTFTVGTRRLRVVCVNTAWMSQLHSQPGGTVFPESLVPDRMEGDSIVLSAFHHPYNWMAPDALRPFRQRVERLSDLVLTGHEHFAEARHSARQTGERNHYIEGGAFQEHGDQVHSEFNVIDLDLDARRQRVISLALGADGSFAPTGSSTIVEVPWEQFQVDRLRDRSAFELSQTTLTTTSDPGVQTTHSTRGPLSLSDFYVFPDLKEDPFPAERVGKVCPGQDIVKMVTEQRRVVILGDELAGKTSLARMLHRNLHENGVVPVLLHGDRKPPLPERVPEYLVTAFREQYSAGLASKYEQLAPARRAVIIDDYHKLDLSRERKRKHVDALLAFADIVVLIADPLELQLDDVCAPAGPDKADLTFARFRILPFGHRKRDELIQKWILLDPESDASGSVFARRVVEVTKLIDTLIGKNYVPSHPVYVLSVLQGYAAGTPIDTHASTHGYFYELFIRTALLRGRAPKDYSILLSYLSNLAARMYRAGKRELLESELREAHDDYVERFDIPRDFGSYTQKLVEQGILLHQGGSYSFKYPYVFYYFVAKWLADNISQDETRTVVRDIGKALADEDNANVMLFLAHLSKDPVVLETVIAAARSTFQNLAPESLEKWPAATVDAPIAVAGLELETRDPRESRNEMLTVMDDVENGVPPAGVPDIDDDGTPPEVREALRLLASGVRTLQVLGQFLKNFPGYLERDAKRAIVKECFELGMRVLRYSLDLIEKHREDCVDGLARLLRSEDSNLSEQTAREAAQETIAGWTMVISFGCVRRVSHSIGSSELGKTYDDVLAAIGTPAAGLVHMSLSLDHLAAFPEEELKRLAKRLAGNYMAYETLRMLTIEHVMLFPLEMAVKQKACSVLDIALVRPGLHGGSQRIVRRRN